MESVWQTFSTLLESWLSHPLARWPLTILYVLTLVLVCVYGIHRYWLVWMYWRNRRNIPRPAGRFTRENLPVVTIQIPMFNEGLVAQRIIDAVCHIDYPKDKLQIQVLDDSTDVCKKTAHQRVEYWQKHGLDIQYLHRTNRSGYKAGALDEAMPEVKGEFIAIFDADFVPKPSFLKRTVHFFNDPKVGMIQGRWEHLNRQDCLLTRCQGIFLDSHFAIQQTGRNRAGHWFNFNGTAGIWRKQAIIEAGGWEHDTLTEDVDLSYRAQMKGWRFIFLQKLGCPAELPAEIQAFKSQQHRWTKGSIQTARKLLWRILSSDAPFGTRLEAFFHLTSPMVYLYVTLMVLLFFPAYFVNLQPFESGTLYSIFWIATLFALGTASAGVFYIESQRALKRSVAQAILHLPALMAIGIGIAINNARACIEALAGHESGFVRTPKYNDHAQAEIDLTDPLERKDAAPTKTRYRWLRLPGLKTLIVGIELFFGSYMLWCIYMAMNTHGALMSIPFLVLFALGYFYVGTLGVVTLAQDRKPPAQPTVETVES